MHDPIEIYEHAGITVEIHFDPDSELSSPRDYENLTELFCHHPRYELGDTRLPANGFDQVDCPRCGGEGGIADHDCDRCFGTGLVTPRIGEWLARQDALAVAPLFVYEHGGITMRAGRIFCLPLTPEPHDTLSRGRFVGDDAGWDTSFVGFAVISRKRMRELCGPSPRSEAFLRDAIESEVSTYADWLEGRVYGYIVAENEIGEDSCWGFVGDPDRSGCKADANAAAEAAAARQDDEKRERSEMAARDIITVGPGYLRQ